MGKSIIYTDSCYKDSLVRIEETLNATVIVRDESKSDIVGYLAGIIANPQLKLIVLNTINERSIIEIGIASFLCKDILVTHKAIDEYEVIKELVTHIDFSCNLSKENNSFLNLIKYIYGDKF